jgi:CheY-like chemotaxis protein
MGMVAAGFAHDLNNMLASIAGHADIASGIDELPSRATESLSAIQQAVTRAKILTENMLSLGRSDYQRFGEVDPVCVVKTTIALIKPRFREEVDVAFTSLLESTDRIFVDQNHLQSALINLLLNAQDSIEGAGTIRLVLEKTNESGDEWLELSVTDSGSGIPPEDQVHVFKPFYTTKKPGDGVGIGLAVVQIFANSVGGSIALESASGEGASFTLSLPMNRGKGVSVQEVSEADPGCFYRVLLVEDYELLRSMLSEALEGLGHSVVPCDGVQEVLDLPSEDRKEIDLLVVDVNLADGDGFDLVATLEKLDSCRYPVVFVTGNPNSLSDRSLQFGQSVLYKPFGMSDLNRELESIMQAFKGQG